MKVDLEEARRIAELAHLEFEETALARMATEMTQILAYIDQLQQIDVAESPASGVTAATLREDVPHATLERENIVANAPSWRDGLFVVPQVIGGE